MWHFCTFCEILDLSSARILYRVVSLVFFRNYITNTWHVCTYLNAFFTVIPNKVMKLIKFGERKIKYCDIFANFVKCLICRLLNIYRMVCLVYFRNYITNTWHVCTYLDAFLMVISNLVMTFNNLVGKFKYCDIFLTNWNSNFKAYFRNYITNTWHVCTYLNAFFTVIPNIVMNFNNVQKNIKYCDIFANFVKIQ